MDHRDVAHHPADPHPQSAHPDSATATRQSSLSWAGPEGSLVLAEHLSDHNPRPYSYLRPSGLRHPEDCFSRPDIAARIASGGLGPGISLCVDRDPAAHYGVAIRHTMQRQCGKVLTITIHGPRHLLPANIRYYVKAATAQASECLCLSSWRIDSAAALASILYCSRVNSPRS